MPTRSPTDESQEERLVSRHEVDSRSDLDSRDPVVGELKRIFAGLPHSSGPAEDLDAGELATIGRYAVLRRIGSGGMGVVYAAYDEDLDRRVAIKLVRAAKTGEAEAAARLRREAQALARLSHPNVIGVHEVGEHGEAGARHVFIAMEFVRGQTLRAWVHASARSPRAVLDVLVQAGRGLAAVHDAALIHRDVKPENVMIGDDGRVRLMDFGLARHDDDERARSRDRDDDRVDAPLTRDGAIVGTPAYMAPEQFTSGSVVGPAADQFAFCVMAWEALYGARPFAGDTVGRLSEAVVGGHRREPRPRSSVPQHVRRALERGLSVEPGSRWPSVTALLGALERDPRRRLGVVGATVVFGGAVAFAATRGAAPGCERDDSMWNDEARERVRAGLIASGAPFAPDTAARVQEIVDAYADAWSAVQVRACEGTDRRLTPELRTAQTLCLEQRRQGVDALVDVLASANADVVERAIQAAEKLPPVDPCTDVEALAARVPPPDDPQTATRVEEVRGELARARALDDAGEYPDASDAATAALADARGLGYGPLIAEALLQVGRVDDSLSNWADAETALREAYAVAVVAGHDEIATDAATRLVWVVGRQLHRHDPGLEWGWLAATQLQRLGPSARREAELAAAIAGVHQVAGELDDALAQFRRAVAVDEAAFGEHDARLAGVLTDLGDVHRQRGEYDDALAAHRRALEIRERTLGPDHPHTGLTLAGLAATRYQRGEYDDAVADSRRAVGILEAALGPDHPRVASALDSLAILHVERGDLDAGVALLQRVVAIREARLGPDHPDTADALDHLAHAFRLREDLAQALPLYERALAIRERALGPGHIKVAASFDNFGRYYYETNEYERAIGYLERSLAIKETTLGAENPAIAATLVRLGDAHLELRHDSEARVSYERALAIREKALGPGHRDVAIVLNNLGNLAQNERDYDGALRLFERALAIFEATDGPDRRNVALAFYNIGQVQLARGEPALAVAALERALELRAKSTLSSLDLAHTRFVLAKTLVAAKRDRGRARALAEAARDAYRELPHADLLLADVEAWLRAQR